MQNIKVRAWDVENKRMLSPDELYKQGFYWIPDGRGFMQRKTGEIFTDDLENKYMNHMIPMLFTSKKDSEGKEIYEAAILRDGDGYLFEVKFGELPLNKSGNCVCTYPAFYAKGYGKLGSPPDYKCEEIDNYHTIIGNIYQNPELLKK